MEAKPIFDFTNEKGNVKVNTRKALRDTTLNKLNQVFDSFSGAKVKNVNGGFSLCLGMDRLTNEPIWAHIELTVNMRDPSIDSYTGKPKRAYEPEVPKLFND